LEQGSVNPGFTRETHNTFRHQQHDTDQHNRGWGIDYSFYNIVRSVRSELSFGVGYTRMTNDADAHDSLHAISLYPQLTLYPKNQSP